jgi:Family of unknown function (DUF6470)
VRVPQLEHSSSPGRISIAQQPARIRIEKSRPSIQIEHGDNSIRIDSIPGRLDIDSTAARQSVGYYTPMAFGDEIVAYSLRQASRGISDKASEGDQKAAVGSGGNPIASIAFQRQFLDTRDRQFVIAFVPKVPPRISYTPRQMSINATYTPPRVQIDYNQPMISTEPASISISSTPASLQMRVNPATLDMTL